MLHLVLTITLSLSGTFFKDSRNLYPSRGHGSLKPYYDVRARTKTENQADNEQVHGIPIQNVDSFWQKCVQVEV